MTKIVSRESGNPGTVGAVTEPIRFGGKEHGETVTAPLESKTAVQREPIFQSRMPKVRTNASGTFVTVMISGNPVEVRVVNVLISGGKGSLAGVVSDEGAPGYRIGDRVHFKWCDETATWVLALN